MTQSSNASHVLRFLTDVVKPWESLNQGLAMPFSLNPEVNDLITQAYSLAVAIKHFPEAMMGLNSEILAKRSRSYEIVSDLADSYKHGALRKPGRNSNLSVSSMFERNEHALVRFLRCRITLHHASSGRQDFMIVARDAALFLERELASRVHWHPQLQERSGPFSDEIVVHASRKNQIAWQGMALEFVQRTEDGGLENVDLNGTVKFVLTSEF